MAARCARGCAVRPWLRGAPVPWHFRPLALMSVGTSKHPLLARCNQCWRHKVAEKPAEGSINQV